MPKSNTNVSLSTGNIEPLNLKSSNIALHWKNWVTQFQIFLRASNLENETDQRKVALLLHYIGTEALQIFYSFNEDIDTIGLETLLTKFQQHFTPKVNITMERHKLFNRRQQITEDIDTYATDLINISLACEFDILRDSIVKDIFSWNLNSKNQYIKERLLHESPATLDKAIEIAKNCELSRSQAKQLQQEEKDIPNTNFVGRIRQEEKRQPSTSRGKADWR